MLVLTSSLIGTPVMSLQTGVELGHVNNVIVDPTNFKILAFELDGKHLDQVPSLLRPQEVREFGAYGLVVDGSDDLIGIDDVIAIRRIYDLNFSVDGLRVVDQNNRKLGRVIDTVVQTKNFIIQQLNVGQPFFKSLGDTELQIHRNQIVEVTRDRVIVRTPTVRSTEQHKSPIPSLVENPFRKAPQPEPSPQSSSIK